MDENNVSSVNAEPAVNVEQQTTTTVNEPVNAGSGEVATPQTEVNPAQTPEQNAEFAKIRREAETKAKDQMIEEMYGDQGIHTYADYQKAIQEQQEEEQRQQYMQQTGIDPNNLKPIFEKWKEQDPDFQEIQRSRAEITVNKAVNDFAQEFPELNVKSIEDIEKLPNADKITQYVQRGMNLNEAYKLANYNDLISNKVQTVQNETIKSITANGQSSPGSLAGGAAPSSTDIWNMPEKDFKSMLERAKRGEFKRS